MMRSARRAEETLLVEDLLRRDRRDSEDSPLLRVFVDGIRRWKRQNSSNQRRSMASSDRRDNEAVFVDASTNFRSEKVEKASAGILRLSNAKRSIRRSFSRRVSFDDRVARESLGKVRRGNEPKTGRASSWTERRRWRTSRIDFAAEDRRERQRTLCRAGEVEERRRIGCRTLPRASA